MSNNKFVKEITLINDDFAKWYTDICKKAGLMDYSSVRGCMVIKPYGYRIWELIQQELDRRLKETGHENVYMPMFIPESLLNKEKDHIEGFAPEVAWITHGGENELEKRMCVRPTSEILFCEHYAKEIQTYRDLPKLYNQWANVVRWEKTTRPFLRTMEFLWQEGHTAHATKEEAEEETMKMLDLYYDFAGEILAIPVIKGQKTEKEKFAGAVSTYTIEALMHDGKALQSGTSHYFGDGFARAFDITYVDKQNKAQYVHQTSWGVTTRLIGGVIMTHGDDNGLVLPPKIAPIEVMVVPIMQKKEGVLDKAYQLVDILKNAGIRVNIDSSNKQPGFKRAETEMKGIPIRVEIGPRDINENKVILARRDNFEKLEVKIDNLVDKVKETLNSIQSNLYNKALAHRMENTTVVNNLDELKNVINEKGGFIKAMWCGDKACEEKIKEETGATARCIPFEQEQIGNTCVCCNKKSKKMVVFAKAY